MFTLDEVIRYNFVPAIRYSFVPARKEEQFCTCNAPKLYRYMIAAFEKHLSLACMLISQENH